MMAKLTKQDAVQAVSSSAFDLEAATYQSLQEALNLLQGKGWTSGQHALNTRGQRTHYADKDCAKLDLYGAIMLAVRKTTYNASEKDLIESLCFRLLKAEMPGDLPQRGIVTFNCMATNAEQVYSLIRKAALQLRSTPLQERNAKL